MNFNLKQISSREINTILKKIRIPFLALILILLLFASAFIYYKFVYQIIITEPELDMAVEDVNQEMLQEILGELDFREETLERVWKSYYKDPFN